MPTKSSRSKFMSAQSSAPLTRRRYSAPNQAVKRSEAAGSEAARTMRRGTPAKLAACSGLSKACLPALIFAAPLLARANSRILATLFPDQPDFLLPYSDDHRLYSLDGGDKIAIHFMPPVAQDRPPEGHLGPSVRTAHTRHLLRLSQRVQLSLRRLSHPEQGFPAHIIFTYALHSDRMPAMGTSVIHTRVIQWATSNARPRP